MVAERPKIFQIGFHKCGTQTLDSFFKANGLNTVHWDQGVLARKMFQNLQEGRPLLDSYEQFEVFTDMEFLSHECHLQAFKLFPYLAQEYPDAIFILNTRDRAAWIRSRVNHRSFTERYAAVYKLTSNEELIDHWIRDWDRHLARVVEFFQTNSHLRLIRFNIDSQNGNDLSGTIPEYELDSRLYGHVGKTKLKTKIKTQTVEGVIGVVSRIFRTIR